MKRRHLPTMAALLLVLDFVSASGAELPEPKFRAVTIDGHTPAGSRVAIADVDGDGLPDIILAGESEIVWYKNPGGNLTEAQPWQRSVIAENLEIGRNVCVAALGADDDGRCEVAAGGDGSAGDAKHPGAAFQFIPPTDRTRPWEPVELPVGPAMRMRWEPLAGGRAALIVAVQQHRENENREDRGVQLLACYPPAGDPHGAWKTEPIGESMPAMYDFAADPVHGGLVVAANEGLVNFRESDGDWRREPFLLAEDVAGWSFKGLAELRVGHARQPFLATTEPANGNSLVCYAPSEKAQDHWQRQVLAADLCQGHALVCGDFLGLGTDQIAIGWRGDPQSSKPAGIHLWAPLGAPDGRWRESTVDGCAMACADLQAADLNGDGKLDLVAVGGSTRRLELYLNESR